MSRYSRTLACGMLLAFGLSVFVIAAQEAKAEVPRSETKTRLLEGSSPITVQQVGHRAPHWRYKYHNGRWWYWMPGNYWMYYNNGWRRHYANRYHNRYYDYGDRRYYRDRWGYRGYPYPYPYRYRDYGYRYPYRDRYYRYGTGYRGYYGVPGLRLGVGFY